MRLWWHAFDLVLRLMWLTNFYTVTLRFSITFIGMFLSFLWIDAGWRRLLFSNLMTPDDAFCIHAVTEQTFTLNEFIKHLDLFRIKKFFAESFICVSYIYYVRTNESVANSRLSRKKYSKTNRFCLVGFLLLQLSIKSSNLIDNLEINLRKTQLRIIQTY